MTRDEAKERLNIPIQSTTYPYDLIDKIYDEFEKELSDYKEMVNWMEENSNGSLCDYYNR